MCKSEECRLTQTVLMYVERLCDVTCGLQLTDNIKLSSCKCSADGFRAIQIIEDQKDSSCDTIFNSKGGAWTSSNLHILYQLFLLKRSMSYLYNVCLLNQRNIWIKILSLLNLDAGVKFTIWRLTIGKSGFVACPTGCGCNLQSHWWVTESLNQWLV